MNTNVIKRYGDVWPYSYKAMCDTWLQFRDFAGNSESERSALYADAIIAFAEEKGLGPDDCYAPPSNRTYRELYAHAFVESLYHEYRRPVYLISTDCYDALLRTSLSGLRMDDFRTPFSTFEVRFPTGRYAELPVALVSLLNGIEYAERNALFCSSLYLSFQTVEALGRPDNGILCNYPVALFWQDDAQIVFPSRGELAGKFEQNGKDRTEVIDHQHVCAALCLLATHAHDELFAPLLTKADQERSGNVDLETIERWHEKASRLSGRRAWVVGRHLKCPTEHKAHSEELSESGRELKYQHWRAGHFHRVRHGSGHSLSKIMWFKPTLVRDDLPVDMNRKRIYDVA